MPETKPTTIEGWTVLDVRGGTAVLEGPDGVRTAARGDTVPGIGRIDSIVRWGNRWIVATANGLIATSCSQGVSARRYPGLGAEMDMARSVGSEPSLNSANVHPACRESIDFDRGQQG